jgi:3-dehydroquinate synthetase
MSVRVELGGRPYEVVIGPGELANLGQIARREVPKARRVLLVHDPGVPEAHVDEAADALARSDFRVERAETQRGEACKSFASLERLLERMVEARLERGDAVISLGGGAVCDVAGFAAAVYRRGVAVIHCPTTLLAMVDASVGGKTGVNLTVGGNLKKNMAGAFWQPAAVIADTTVLRSLPDRELRAGIAECLKHGMLGAHAEEPDLLAWTGQVMAAVTARQPVVLAELVERNVRLKARIIGSDVREESAEGGRALLNLGHTFGHVVEGLPGAYAPDHAPPLLHGECVALGLIAAARCAESMGISPVGTAEQVRAAVSGAGLPTSVRGLPDNATLIDLMSDDKKTRGGVLRVVLPAGTGRAIVVTNPDRDALGAGWDQVRRA